MEIIDVLVDWAGKYGLILEGGAVLWIRSVLGCVFINAFVGIELLDGNRIALIVHAHQRREFSIDQIQTHAAWERGTIMQRGKPEFCTIARAPGTTLVTGNGHCYVAEDVDHVLVGNADLYQIDLATGKLLSPKLVPSYTHRLRFSDSFDTVLQLLHFDNCEMNELGLLQMVAPNGKVFYSELFEGEMLQHDSNCIVTSNHHRMFCIKRGFMDNISLEIIDLRLPGRYTSPESGMLCTFYRTYSSHNGVFALLKADVTKLHDRITEVKMRGKKAMPAILSYDCD